MGLVAQGAEVGVVRNHYVGHNNSNQLLSE